MSATGAVRMTGSEGCVRDRRGSAAEKWTGLFEGQGRVKLRNNVSSRDRG
jgi:hypothetical protein